LKPRDQLRAIFADEWEIVDSESLPIHYYDDPTAWSSTRIESS
jgi:hypothetical protein